MHPGYLVAKCCTFGRRDCAPSAAKHFDLRPARIKIALRQTHKVHNDTCVCGTLWGK